MRKRIIAAMGVALFSLSVFAACAGATPKPTPTLVPTLTPTPLTAAVVTKLDVGVGTPPAVGWKWAVAELKTGTDEVIDGPTKHDLTWVFIVVKGSAEVSTAEGKKTVSSGEAVIIPAGQEHTHRYLPQSQLLAFQIRPADPPPGRLHGGSQVFLSEKPLEVKAGSDYKVRVREFTLSPGSRTSESFTAEPNFGYVVEGALTSRISDSMTTTETGRVFTLPLNVRHVESNEGITPCRFLLVDVHP